ncbi:MAG: outer membrane beta-barrel protein [Chryseolinea sp.]
MKRFTVLLLCLTVVISGSAQEKKRKPTAYNKAKQSQENDKFLEKQWWLGFKAGANLSKVTVDKTYSVVSPTNYEASTIGKKYDNFNLIGSQATIEVSFYFKRFLISFQPTYQHCRFAYTNSFEWISESDEQYRVELKYAQEQKLDHAIFPLLIKYDIYGNRLRPYIQAGIYSAMLINASKSVEVSGIDNAAGGENEFHTQRIDVGADDLFAKYHWGLMGGAGVNYNLGNHVRLNLDIMYKYGMSNISSTDNRYGNDRLSGVGDAMDDLTMDNISVSIGCLFPLRFLQSSLQTLDK